MGQKPPFKSHKSKTWNYYTRQENFTASCNFCGVVYSYRTTVSNLKKHLVQKHREHLQEDGNEEEQHGHFGGEEHHSLPQELSPQFCKYYIPTPKEEVAHCRLCNEDVVGGAEELIQHVTDHHQQEVDTDDEDSGPKTVWSYFIRQANSVSATCVLCKASISFRAGVKLLRKHLHNRHPKVNIDEEDSKTLLLSANGQLFEVESENDHDDDSQVDPMNTVYLDEYAGMAKKRRKRPRTPLFAKRRENVASASFQRNQVEQRESLVIDNSANQKEKEPTDNPCLIYFNKYLMALMKDLPDRISGQLQADILKLVLEAKIACDTRKEVDYNITLLNNNPNESVTVTVSETQVSGDDNCSLPNLDP